MLLKKMKQGKLQECDQKFTRLTTLQKAVGVRRSELGKLVGADLIQRGNSWYVRIRRGKGGKAQLQFILPKDVPAIALEAGVRTGWARYTGSEDRVLGIDRFGASAPGKTVYKELGFTVDHVVDVVKKLK